jgi:hypothetical protein
MWDQKFESVSLQQGVSCKPPLTPKFAGYAVRATPRIGLFYHPLNIYRKQVIKQADVVLAMFLLGAAFTAKAKKRNFDFYDPLTTGDSSLSSCVEAIIAAQVGDVETRPLAWLELAQMMSMFSPCSARPNWVMPSPPGAPG